MKASFLAYLIWVLAGLFWLAVQLAYAAGLRINHTPSLPVGLWQLKPVQEPLRPGEIASFCPPEGAALREAKRRGWIDAGECPGGYQPMLKQVAAVGGSLVEVDEDSVHIDGQAIAGAGRLPLANAIPTGAYRLSPGQFWALSLFPRSFDSRYFGPVPMDNIQGTASSFLR